MATAEILDLEKLTAPIAGESPVGTDLRTDTSPASLYYRIKDLRSQARKSERQLEMGMDDDVEPPDWRPLVEAVPELLAERTKDLELAAYFIEGLAREYGFAGLRDGFRLVNSLVEQFGDVIYPLPDEDGEETRLAPLSGLNGDGANGTLIGPIGAIPLTSNSSVGEFGQSAYVQAKDLERASPEARERRISQGAVSLDTFQAAINESSSEFLVNLVGDIRECREAYATMTATLDAKYGQHSPPSSQIRELLEECQRTLETVARDKLAVAEMAPPEEEEEAAESDAPAESSSSSRPATVLGKIENRDDAFREVMRIAQYFRKTEPHSPISYALEQIVRWGRLPLPDLLKELISDESSISQMFRLVGIRGDHTEETQ
ncbi:MAG: type VI secretion system protein TssA [Planctomycetales bacterium]|nr:type VI secretion system protein TssA [Planctomycetales bacterium]